MDFNKAFKIMFGFDISNFDEAYKESRLGGMLGNLEDARELKAAYELMKAKFGWKVDFSIYRYPNCRYPDGVGYAVERDDMFSIPGIEKVE